MGDEGGGRFCFQRFEDDVVEQVQSIRGENLLDQIGLQMMFATSLDEINFDIDDETGDIENDDETKEKEKNGDENE